jgi:hypothetical protein
VKRLKKYSPLSLILTGLSFTLVTLTILTAAWPFGILAILLFIFGRMAMKKETYDEYRDRYETQFGMQETDEDDEEKKQNEK